MLNIPKPKKQTTIKLNISEDTRVELQNFVKFIQSQQPHATQDKIIEAMLNKVIPITGCNAKAYKEFKNSIKS